MTTYVTADPHFAKEGTNVLSRPFADAREMSEAILDAYNSRAGKHDRLIIAGDFSFKEPEYWRARLKCKNIVLCLGNHDVRAKCIRAFGPMNVRDTYDTKICGHPCYIQHYPCCVWSKSHYSSYHLYGHVHDQRESTFDALFPGRRSMDCSVDTAKRILGEYTCFSEDELFEILSARPGWDDVNWYRAQRGEYFKDEK